MKLISFDPGKSTGWAIFDTERTDRLVTEFGTCRSTYEMYRLLDSLQENEIEIIVFEDYIIRPPTKAKGFEHAWNKGDTLRIIGAIEYASWMYKVPAIAVQPMMKPAAYGIVGLKYTKGKKNMHHYDAIVHGYMHIHRNKLAPNNLILGALGNG